MAHRKRHNHGILNGEKRRAHRVREGGPSDGRRGLARLLYRDEPHEPGDRPAEVGEHVVKPRTVKHLVKTMPLLRDGHTPPWVRPANPEGR